MSTAWKVSCRLRLGLPPRRDPGVPPDPTDVFDAKEAFSPILEGPEGENLLGARIWRRVRDTARLCVLAPLSTLPAGLLSRRSLGEEALKGADEPADVVLGDGGA